MVIIPKKILIITSDEYKMINSKELFKRQMNMEQQFYDHSFRARILGSDSYMLSRYLYHLRMASWYEIAPPHFGTNY